MSKRKKLSDRDLQKLHNHINDNKFRALSTIVQQCKSPNHTNVSKHTVQKHLPELNLKNYVAINKPYLSQYNIKLRMEWAQ